MRFLIIAAVVGVVMSQPEHTNPHHDNHTSRHTSVAPPTPSGDSPTISPVELATSTDASWTDASNDTGITTEEITSSVSNVTDDTGTTDTTVTSPSTSAPVEVTPTYASCHPRLHQIAAVDNYTNEESFLDLSENQQVLIYELLAAAENCALKSFLTPQTAQRIFLVTEDLPLRQVYNFISFLSRSLEAEGIVVPV